MDENKVVDAKADVVDLEGAINLVSETQAGKNYECKFCKEATPHMMVVMAKSGDIHVHAPFENRFLMNQFMEAIIDEQKKYKQK